MKAFWTIVPAVQVNGAWRPDLPVLPSLVVINPLDINRLPAGAGAAAHLHVIVGNIALMSDQAGGDHEHFVSDAGLTILRGAATAHTHANPGAPDFFMCFVRCSDADFVTLTGATNNIKPVVMVAIDAAGITGLMDDIPWSEADPLDYNRRTFWATRSLNILGITLPAAVDRGKRLWLMLAGMFQARRPADDRGLRG